MDPQGESVLEIGQSDQQDTSQQFTPEYSPPRRNLTVLIIVGVVFLILLIVISVIFLLVRSRTNTSQSQNGTSSLSPQPTPSFYELVSADIQGQEAKLNELSNDIRELEAVFTYESINFTDVLTPPPVQTPEWEEQKTDIAKARAELEIDRRVATLDKLSPKIAESEKLSEAQKSQLTNEVDSEIATLSSLKGRIVIQTDFSALTADINTLSEFYKNYQVIVPKVYTVVTADKINVFGDSLTVIAEKLSQKTGELHALGKDVAGAQKTLGHMLFVMGDAAIKGEAALTSVLPLFSSDYPKNKSILLNAKGQVQASHKGLNLAVSDGKNIINALIAIESGRAPSTNFFQFFPLFRQ